LFALLGDVAWQRNAILCVPGLLQAYSYIHHWRVNSQPPGSTVLWLLSVVLCFCLSYYKSLTHYDTLHLTCSLRDFHIQQRSICLFLLVRTLFFAVSTDSLAHFLSILSQTRFITAISQWFCLASCHILWKPLCICCSYRHIHWSYKKPQADKQRWMNGVSTKSNLPWLIRKSSDIWMKNDTFAKLTTVLHMLRSVVFWCARSCFKLGPWFQAGYM